MHEPSLSVAEAERNLETSQQLAHDHIKALGESVRAQVSSPKMLLGVLAVAVAIGFVLPSIFRRSPKSVPHNSKGEDDAGAASRILHVVTMLGPLRRVVLAARAGAKEARDARNASAPAPDSPRAGGEIRNRHDA